MQLRQLIVAAGLLLVASCSVRDEITPQLYVGLVVAHAGPLKRELGHVLLISPTGPVPKAGPLTLPPLPGTAPIPFDFGWVTRSGAIVVHSRPYGVVIVQEPTVDGGRIHWSCTVHPPEAKPALCGSDYQDAQLQPAR